MDDLFWLSRLQMKRIAPGRVPWRGVGAAARHRDLRRVWPGQAATGGQLDDGIVAQGRRWFPGSCSGRAERPTRRSARARMAPTRRMMASSLGKMPTTSVRRLISPLRRSMRIGRCRSWAGGRNGKLMIGEHVALGLVHQRRRALDTLARSWSATWRHWRARRLSASSWAKAVPMKAATTRAALPAGMGQHVAHEVDAAALPGGVAAPWRRRPSALHARRRRRA